MKYLIDPDKRVQHGGHVDEYWPGTVYSTWKRLGGRLTIRRERLYADRQYQTLRQTGWQVWFQRGRTVVGFRIERKARIRDW